MRLQVGAIQRKKEKQKKTHKKIDEDRRETAGNWSERYKKTTTDRRERTSKEAHTESLSLVLILETIKENQIKERKSPAVYRLDKNLRASSLKHDHRQSHPQKLFLVNG